VTRPRAPGPMKSTVDGGGGLALTLPGARTTAARMDCGPAPAADRGRSLLVRTVLLLDPGWAASLTFRCFRVQVSALVGVP